MDDTASRTTSPTPGTTPSTTPGTVGGAATTLRRLYFVRFAFAVVWAAVVLSMASHLGPLTGTLLVLYPLFDVAAAVVDARASRSRGATTGALAGLYANMAVSLLTAVAVGFAATSGIPAVLRVWGTWAIVAGLIQLVVAVRRRRMGGQWPLIVSGAVSALAGASFIAGAGAADPVLTGAAGYAVPGAVFFLISALRLGRAARAEQLSA
ncbi:hypothetical protein [Kineococcus aurantiacus]|uniref:Uncharacterized membrane protein HdeD (DUF308 family) n=1 Tax=Kineococcus aurantiacus TaxID=37633 RepID=A0A7Y9DQ83_9ACTN|nr:hypothetical protein [Kineococcus aurantiacus]NYD24805.1 uncharacterized membrane protein HdeD (DUF308 family) [Kineococcus aurantiacus]